MMKCKDLKNVVYTDVKGKKQELNEAYLFADGALFEIYRQDYYIYTSRIKYKEINTDTDIKPQWAGDHDGEEVLDLYSLQEINLDLYEITEDLDLALEY